MTIKATLITSQGDDLVVDAARASFAKTHDTYTSEQNERLINYLARHDHWTPFSHPRFTFIAHQSDIDLYSLSQPDVAGMVWQRCTFNPYGVYVRHSFYGWANLIKNGKVSEPLAGQIDGALFDLMPRSHAAFFGYEHHEDYTLEHLNHPDFIDVTLLYEVPIFVARQEFKHMVGFTRNERSGRYVTADTEFYYPDVWRLKPEGSIKQGSGDGLCEHLCIQTSYGYTDAIDGVDFLYSDMLENDVAPEMARMVLPQSMMTSYVVTANLTGLARFVYQRTKPDAQKEIQDLAHQVNALLIKEFGSEWNKGI